MSVDHSHNTHHFEHAKQRAKERYKIDLTEADVAGIAKQIAGGRARIVGFPRGSSAVWLVRVGKKVCKVVWNANHDSVVTFLPLR